MGSQFPLARLYQNKPLMQKILAYLQKRYRIELLLFLHEHGTVQWRDLKHPPHRICNDGTFRAACVELTLMGLATPISLDRVNTKHKWRLTDLGVVVADIVKRAIRDIEILVSPEKVIAKK